MPIAAVSGVAVLAYLAVALVRIRYPFELEWMEGGSVDHVRRVLAGEPLYVEPSIEFVPYIYTPLYFYVAAAVSKVVGLGYLALRLVSLASSIAATATIFLLVRKETRSALFGLLSCGMFLASFRSIGAWYDIARVDSLFLFLALLAAYRCRVTTTWRSAAVAGLLASLSFLTKQSALAIGVALGVYLLRRNPRWAAAYAGTLGTVVVATTLVANVRSGGWYAFYVLELPQRHEILDDLVVGFWTRDMARLWPAAVVSAVVLGFGAWRRREVRALLWFYAPLTGSMVAAAWIGRVHSGGYDNVLMPAFAAASLLFGVSAARLVAPATSPTQYRRSGAVLVAVLVQFGLLAYDPFEQVPTSADLAAGRSLVRTIEGFDGEVWLPGHGHFTSDAGRGSFAQGFAMFDVLRAEGSKGKEPLLRSISEAVEAQRFSAVIVESDPALSVLPPEFDRYYAAQGPLFSSPDVLYPVTGARLRPETVYLRTSMSPGT